MNGPILHNKFWAREKGDQEEGVVGGLFANISMNVCKAKKDQMGHTVTSHDLHQ